MKDADAAIWVTDLSSNGVWVNEKRIPKNEATKIYNRDIISFTPGAPGKGVFGGRSMRVSVLSTPFFLLC